MPKRKLTERRPPSKKAKRKTGEKDRGDYLAKLGFDLWRRNPFKYTEGKLTERYKIPGKSLRDARRALTLNYLERAGIERKKLGDVSRFLERAHGFDATIKKDLEKRTLALLEGLNLSIEDIKKVHLQEERIRNLRQKDSGLTGFGGNYRNSASRHLILSALQELPLNKLFNAVTLLLYFSKP